MAIREISDESIGSASSLRTEIGDIMLEFTPEFNSKMIDDILWLYSEDRHHHAILELEKLVATYNIDVNQYPKLVELQKDYKEIRNIIKNFDDNEGWSIESKGDIKVYYKRVPGTPTVSIMMETTFDLPIFNILTLIYESELYPLWIPFCKTSKCLHKLDRSRKILLQFYSVAGVAKRETCIYGYGTNLLDTDGGIMIVSSSCDQENTFKGCKLPSKGKNSRAVVNFLGCFLKPITRNRCQAKFISNFDPVLKMIPYRILNYFSRKLAKGMMKRAKKHASKFEGSPWQENMNKPENRDFYDHISVVLEEFYQNKGL